MFQTNLVIFDEARTGFTNTKSNCHQESLHTLEDRSSGLQVDDDEQVTI
jgi:hypothetical protein